MLDKLLKQKNVGAWWGAFRNLGSYVSFYLFLVNTAILIVNTYVLGNMAVYGLPIPMWMVIGITLAGFAVLLVVAMVFEHKYTIPSFMTYWNQQWWNHSNPARTEIKTMQEQLDRIEQKLDNKPPDRTIL